jgi:hypothetical protein
MEEPQGVSEDADMSLPQVDIELMAMLTDLGFSEVRNSIRSESRSV